MAELLYEIEWGLPTLPKVNIPEWEAEVKSDMGMMPDILTRVSRSPWIRNIILKWPRYEVQEIPKKLAHISALVASQENACRYCYGVARSQMRLFGYSEKMISGIERDMLMAELDEKERVFIRFCRDLARSSPRPPKADRDKLISLGFSPLAVAEMAFLVVNHCFVNRVSTFIAVPPMDKLEKLSESFIGRILRPLIVWKMKKQAWTAHEQLPENLESFPGVVQSLKGLPAAAIVNQALEGAFESSILSKKLKMLMFAVVARSLECKFCQAETHKMALDLGFTEQEFSDALTSLSSHHLTATEETLLAWTRETIHFQSAAMQKRIRKLTEEIGEPIMLEAFGVAALANSTVRLAVLLGE